MQLQIMMLPVLYHSVCAVVQNAIVGMMGGAVERKIFVLCWFLIIRVNPDLKAAAAGFSCIRDILNIVWNVYAMSIIAIVSPGKTTYHYLSIMILNVKWNNHTGSLRFFDGQPDPEML